MTMRSGKLPTSAYIIIDSKCRVGPPLEIHNSKWRVGVPVGLLSHQISAEGAKASTRQRVPILSTYQSIVAIFFCKDPCICQRFFDCTVFSHEIRFSSIHTARSISTQTTSLYTYAMGKGRQPKISSTIRAPLVVDNSTSSKQGERKKVHVDQLLF